VRRRDVITVIAGAATAWPLAVRAQESGRIHRIAVLFPNPQDSPMYRSNGLRDFGFVEGQNLTIDFRAYEQHPELITKYSDELFKAPADVFLAAGDVAIRAAQQATTTISI
jgi:putative ABC transport system substrate-binding protein